MENKYWEILDKIYGIVREPMANMVFIDPAGPEVENRYRQLLKIAEKEKQNKVEGSLDSGI